MADPSILTPLQQRFVDEYQIDLNGTAAYLRAGYKVKNEAVARANASRLLTHANIRAALAVARKDQVARVEITQDYVLTRLRENVERAMRVEPVKNAAGDPTGEYRYEGAVANKALELLGKHLGLFPNKHEHSGPAGAAVEVKVSHDIAADLAAELAPYADVLAGFLGARRPVDEDGPPKSVADAQTQPQAGPVPPT